MSNAFEHGSHMIARSAVYGKTVDPAEEYAKLDQPVPQSFLGEIPISLPTRHALGENEIVRLETERDGLHARSGPSRNLEANQSFLPARRRFGRFRSNAIGVVAVGPMEHRAVSERTVDLVSPLRPSVRVEVRPLRAQHDLRRVRETRENRLAANDHQLGFSRNLGRRRDHVLEVSALHRPSPDLLDNFPPLLLGKETGKRRVLTEIVGVRVIGLQDAPNQ